MNERDLILAAEKKLTTAQYDALAEKLTFLGKVIQLESSVSRMLDRAAQCFRNGNDKSAMELREIAREIDTSAKLARAEYNERFGQ